MLLWRVCIVAKNKWNVRNSFFWYINYFVVVVKLTESLIDKNNLIVVPNATHDTGFEDYLSLIDGK